MNAQLIAKIAIVTGASRGIGKAIAIALAKNGCTIVVNHIASEEALAQETVSEIISVGGKAVKIQADVRNLEEVQRMADQVFENYGNISILVNNAGITKDRTILNMSSLEWQDVIDTNLTGVFNCTKAIVKYMVQQGYGTIVNISSVMGLRGNYGQCNYAASKAGVIGFTKTIAKEVAKKGITVNAIAPGFIETDMFKSIPMEIKDGILEKIPLKRLGKPEEIAELVLFLATKTTYITGQVITVDGGLYI